MKITVRMGKDGRKYITINGKRIYKPSVNCADINKWIKDEWKKFKKPAKKAPKKPKPPGDDWPAPSTRTYTAEVELKIPEGKQLVAVQPIVERKKEKKEKEEKHAPSGGPRPPDDPRLPPLEPLSPLIELTPLDIPRSGTIGNIADRAASVRDRARETADRLQKLVDSRKAKEKKYPGQVSEHATPVEEVLKEDYKEGHNKTRLIAGIAAKIFTKDKLREKMLETGAPKDSVNNMNKLDMIHELLDAGDGDVIAVFRNHNMTRDYALYHWDFQLDAEPYAGQTGSGDVLNTVDINKILERYKPEYLGAFPRNEWPDMHPGRNAIVMNFDVKGGTGTHWVGIIILSSGTVMYFDSFGRPMPTDMIESLKPQLLKLNPKTHFKLKENAIQVQNPQESTCGWHVVNWIRDMIGRNKSFRESTGFDDSIKGEQDVDKLQKKFDKYL